MDENITFDEHLVLKHLSYTLLHKYLKMAIFMYAMLSVCVFHVDCRYISRSSVKHLVMHKRSISDGDKEYVNCYDEFMGLFYDNDHTYHGLCHVRQKLKVCKEIVKRSYPRVQEHTTYGCEDENEKVADFWCTYNTTHQRPAKPFFKVDDMYRKYTQCPYLAGIMVTHEDYSPGINVKLGRALLAQGILIYTGAHGLSLWQMNHKYSDPQDSVHKALSAWWCELYKYQTYFTDTIMSRYCVIVKDIYNDFSDVLGTFTRHTAHGLYNWTRSQCSEYEDPLEQVMRISQLELWLCKQKKPDLPQCHDHNIYIEGATCLIMFHTRLPPYSGIHNVMPPFVKNIVDLNSCWDQVISGCPHPSSARRNISLIIDIYNLASNISKEGSAHIWHVIFLWSDFYKNKTIAQKRLQGFYQILLPDTSSYTSFPLAFGSSLVEALQHLSALPQITALFSKLSSALYKVSVVGNDGYSGVNIFEGFHSMNKYVLELLLNCFQPLYELFVEVGEFVQYKGLCPEWWPPPCGA